MPEMPGPQGRYLQRRGDKREGLRTPRQSNLLASVLIACPPALSTDAVRFLARCLGDDIDRLTVDRVIRDLGVPLRTLNEHLARVGLAAPGHVLRVCRLLTAARLLIFESQSVERTAHQIGIGRAATLRSNPQRYFGMNPGALRLGGRGAWSAVLSSLPGALARGSD